MDVAGQDGRHGFGPARHLAELTSSPLFSNRPASLATQTVMFVADTLGNPATTLVSPEAGFAPVAGLLGAGDAAPPQAPSSSARRTASQMIKVAPVYSSPPQRYYRLVPDQLAAIHRALAS